MSTKSNKPASAAPRIARAAARYRPGKAPTQDDDYGPSSEEEGREERDVTPEQGKVVHAVAPEISSSRFRPVGGVASHSQLAVEADTESDEEGDSDEDEDRPALARPTFRKPGQASVIQPRPASASASSSSEYESESESSEEEQRKPLAKPIFVPKSQRGQVNPNRAAEQATGSATDAADAQEKRALEKAEVRRQEAHRLAANRIRQALAEEEQEEQQVELSDTDGRDPEGEFAAWRLRELARVKRERDRRAQMEQERDDVERRRAMPEAQRDREDRQRVAAQRAEKEQLRRQQRAAAQEEAGGQGGLLQRYHHKGSFFQDLDIVQRQDAMAPTESAVHRTNLPAVMQVADYGKKGRSKWTGLANEDTSRSADRFAGRSSHSGRGHEGPPGRGANSIPVRQRDRDWTDR